MSSRYIVHCAACELPLSDNACAAHPGAATFMRIADRAAVEKCERCGGEGELDDRGFAFCGQPFLFAVTCPDCGGAGVVP